MLQQLLKGQALSPILQGDDAPAGQAVFLHDALHDFILPVGVPPQAGQAPLPGLALQLLEEPRGRALALAGAGHGDAVEEGVLRGLCAPGALVDGVVGGLPAQAVATTWPSSSRTQLSSRATSSWKVSSLG